MTRRSELKPVVGRPVEVLRRKSPRQLGYDAAWDRLAKRRRDADYGLCQACLAEERLTVASDVDHIVPLHVRPDWRLEYDNTQVLCRMHHRRKTQRDGERYGSSTATTLTTEQRQAREEAQQLESLPRSTPGGYLLSTAFPMRSVAYPARVFPRNWGRGGS